MSVAKKYFKEEVQWKMIDVEHPQPADFYLSVWQTNRSAAPLLVLRTLLFLTAVGITLTSMVFYILKGRFGFWFIYLTHWGLLVITLTSGFSTAVSARCQFYGPINSQFRLPWYVKVYWILYNIAVPLAFLITIFYWSILYEAGVEEELNKSLDVLVHGMNTVLMFMLLITASQPSRLLHIYQPLLFALMYFMFGLIYYLAGGVDYEGNPWVYSVINWNNPGTTVGIGAITGLLLVLLYFLTIAIALARDFVARKYVKRANNLSLDGTVYESVPLRQPPQTNV